MKKTKKFGMGGAMPAPVGKKPMGPSPTPMGIMPRNPNLKTPITSAPVTQNQMSPKKGSSLPPYLPPPVTQKPTLGTAPPTKGPINPNIQRIGAASQKMLQQNNGQPFSNAPPPAPTAGMVPGQLGNPSMGAAQAGPRSTFLGSATMGSPAPANMASKYMKKGGKVQAKSKSSPASKRGDGCAIKGKTKGRFV